MGLMLGDHWCGSGSLEESICHDYEIDSSLLDRYDVLVGGYWSGCYSGRSWLLLRDKLDGKLYEVHGSHCSCHGLEGQFEPSLTTVTYLKSDHFPYRVDSDSPDEVSRGDRLAILEVISSLPG